jgi:hypothetical protein
MAHFAKVAVRRVYGSCNLSHGSGNKTRDEQQGSSPRSWALSGGFAVANNKAQASRGEEWLSRRFYW